MTAPWLAMIGIGEDGWLAPPARALVEAAGLVVGGRRHLALADGLIRGERLPWPSPIEAAFPAILARRGRPTAVLASGDPFCFGIGATLAAHVPAAEMLCHPVPSAFALARARLGWAAADVAELSACGRPLEAIIPAALPGARLLVLSAGSDTPGELAALLVRLGFGASAMVVLEAMGGPAERLRHTTAEGFDLIGVAALNTVAVTVAGATPRHLATGLPDAVFAHDGQLTRREIRAVTLSSLAPRPGELLWDVGAGAGSVGIEWMLRCPSLRTIAIEANAERVVRIGRNAAALGVPGLRVVHGEAPAALAGLPTPDAIFLGGGAHQFDIIETAWAALPPGGRLVANAVTVETELAVLTAQFRLGGTMVRLSVGRLDPVGPMHAFRPAMTVTQWQAVKP